MEVALKRKREESVTQIPNKINVQKHIRVITNPSQEESEVDNEETNISNNNSGNNDSTRGNRDEDDEEEVNAIKVKKAKEKQGMREDGESVATTKVDNVKKNKNHFDVDTIVIKGTR